MHVLSEPALDQRLVIRGGIPLCGTVEVSGSKNASLPMMAAAILADGPVALHGEPHLRDVSTMAETLRCLGLSVHHAPSGLLELKTIDPRCHKAPEHLVSQMRASFCVLGPLLATRGRAVVALPGGCAIGHRPVDLHLRGLAALGVTFHEADGYVFAHAERLQGANVDLTGPHGSTVTGTANVLSAATLAEGRTVIESAAREPEIVELGEFLISMGAKITGLGTGRIVVQGVTRLHGTSFTLPGDRIEACTYLMAAAITGGDIRVNGIDAAGLERVLDVLHRAGHDLIIREGSIRLIASPHPKPINTTAEPYPGVPTDIQPLLTACALVSQGRSHITDRVFPERFAHVAQMARLGGDLRHNNATVTVDGQRGGLQGGQVKASDLRGGAALVLAGLAANGESVIRGVQHLDRGYERLEQKLSALGARIRRITVPRTRSNGEYQAIETGGLVRSHVAALSVAVRRA